MDNIKKAITREMKAIKRQYGVAGIKLWEVMDVEDMSGNEAFDRGYYRALEGIQKTIIKEYGQKNI